MEFLGVRGEDHRHADLQARRQYRDQKITPELKRVSRGEMHQFRSHPDGPSREDERNIYSGPNRHGESSTLMHVKFRYSSNEI